ERQSEHALGEEREPDAQGADQPHAAGKPCEHDGDVLPPHQAQALLEAMRRLEVPVQEQIQMFRTLEQSNGLSVPLEFQ
ncbi:MAG: hypothetical protein ACNA8P_01990, partial [Phycisphaerales bacterium]